MAHLLEKAHVAPNEWPTIDLYQRIEKRGPRRVRHGSVAKGAIA
jgi:hypothetical protein